MNASRATLVRIAVKHALAAMVPLAIMSQDSATAQLDGQVKTAHKNASKICLGQIVLLSVCVRIMVRVIDLVALVLVTPVSLEINVTQT
jgi:hypothetical protein